LPGRSGESHGISVQFFAEGARCHLGRYEWALFLAYLGDQVWSGFILDFGNTPLADIPHAVRKLRKMLT
jgi:hypothetical protein